MKKTPLVSIIMPVYNVDAFLEEAVKSMVEQSYPEWELILVDDGSQDNSPHLCDEFASKDTRIRVIHQGNQGLSGARNTGIRQAQGKYIVFIDSDDYLAKEMLKETVELAEEQRLDCVLYEGISFYEDSSLAVPWGHREKRTSYEGRLDAKEAFREMLLNKDYHPSACAYLLKTEVLKKTPLFFYPGILHEDELFTVQMLFQCDKIGISYVPYYHRRVRENSIITNPKNTAKKGIGLIIVFCELAKLYAEYPEQGIEAEILDIRLREILARITTLYIQSNPAVRREMKKDMKKCIHTVQNLNREWVRDKEVRNVYERYRLLAWYYDFRMAVGRTDKSNG